MSIDDFLDDLPPEYVKLLMGGTPGITAGKVSFMLIREAKSFPTVFKLFRKAELNLSL